MSCKLCKHWSTLSASTRNHCPCTKFTCDNSQQPTCPNIQSLGRLHFSSDTAPGLPCTHAPAIASYPSAAATTADSYQQLTQDLRRTKLLLKHTKPFTLLTPKREQSTVHHSLNGRAAQIAMLAAMSMQHNHVCMHTWLRIQRLHS